MSINGFTANNIFQVSISCCGVARATKRPGKGQSCESSEEEEEEGQEDLILDGNMMGLPMIPTFHLQNGTTERSMTVLNYWSSQATFLNAGHLGSPTLNHQMCQLFEIINRLLLQLGKRNATVLVQSSLFLQDDYIQLFLQDDYIQLFLQGSFGLSQQCYSLDSAPILVKQIIKVVQNAYNAKARKIICMGIGPPGCETYNATNQTGADVRYHNEEIRHSILQYNVMLSEQLLDLNANLFDARAIFCDVYHGLMQILHDVRPECCGMGRYGGMGLSDKRDGLQ